MLTRKVLLNKSLTAKLKMCILGTVRMSLLHVIMMIMMTLPVVPNIRVTADTGNQYCSTALDIFYRCSFSVSVSVFVSLSISSMGV
jgi:hypothetical protein